MTKKPREISKSTEVLIELLHVRMFGNKYIFPLNVPLQIDKYTPRGTCAPRLGTPVLRSNCLSVFRKKKYDNFSRCAVVCTRFRTDRNVFWKRPPKQNLIRYVTALMPPNCAGLQRSNLPELIRRQSADQ